MKKKLSALVFMALMACNDNAQKKVVRTSASNDSVNANNTVMTETAECYANTSSKDSIMLTLTIKAKQVTGSMHFQIEGKDKNQGTLQGEMRGDTLYAEYTFLSEGLQSVRQVAYLKKDNNLFEGYGDIEERENKMVFKNTGGLVFGKGVVLKRTMCR